MSTATPATNITDRYEFNRLAMVDLLRSKYRILDEHVLKVMARLPRHRFVPEAIESQAYQDNALPIAGGQTISQPYIVARMTELLELKGDEKVLEIGAGTGYQTAILSSLANRVYSIERLPNLAAEAESRLVAMGFQNVTIKAGDGTQGWADRAPFDAILVAASGPSIPMPLVSQLRVGGKLVVPVGGAMNSQDLILVTRTPDGYTQTNCGPCAFVPLIGEHGWK
ncbi:MAG TPA: protein-L-isoaspartate(D-aspartate) O-methyltransferase [Pyrinomonadaceae bacterium]|nr:protein-L-isoaspartate(D-aspartate) O-methyltransferase [Pyrinomonadaceae bacterium]